jgi:CMP-2-keto-3-deoxyoctulosonic acid synthetase
MEPDKIMDGLSKELMTALKDMAKTKNLDEKIKCSQVVKNLCDSLGVFLDFAGSMMPYDDEEEDGQIPF